MNVENLTLAFFIGYFVNCVRLSPLKLWFYWMLLLTLHYKFSAVFSELVLFTFCHHKIYYLHWLHIKTRTFERKLAEALTSISTLFCPPLLVWITGFCDCHECNFSCSMDGCCLFETNKALYRWNLICFGQHCYDLEDPCLHHDLHRLPPSNGF